MRKAHRQQTPMNSKIISVKLPEHLLAEVDEVVCELDYDRSKWIRFLIRTALKERKEAARDRPPHSDNQGGGQFCVDPV